MQHFVVRFGFVSFFAAGVEGGDDSIETEEGSGQETPEEKPKKDEFSLSLKREPSSSSLMSTS
jgi:hypothetical protein